MLKIYEILDRPAEPEKTLKLAFEQRQKSRLKTSLTDDTEVGLFLERGHILRNGDCLKAEDGTIILIEAAPEPVSTVRDEDMLAIAKAAYHLGNRHVQVEVGQGWLRYSQDHVLDEMIKGFGLKVVQENAPFEPESGAYGAHSHSHSHSHGANSGHSHVHE